MVIWVQVQCSCSIRTNIEAQHSQRPAQRCIVQPQVVFTSSIFHFCYTMASNSFLVQAIITWFACPWYLPCVPPLKLRSIKLQNPPNLLFSLFISLQRQRTLTLPSPEIPVFPRRSFQLWSPEEAFPGHRQERVVVAFVGDGKEEKVHCFKPRRGGSNHVRFVL